MIEINGYTIEEKVEIAKRHLMPKQLGEQGVKKGREQGVRDTLLHLLAKRFGKISPTVRRRVEAIGSVDELTGLVDRLLEVRSIEELGLGS